MTPIIMVDRGNCTFVTKARNIERAGVHLAIIIDNQREDSENIIMSDDGTGSSINIPSFIIRKHDGDLIKEQLANVNSSSVYIKAQLDMAHPDNRVEYEFWYSTVIDTEPWLVYDLSLYQKALGRNAQFTPRILTYSCKGCTEEIKKSLCLADGNYCPYFPKQKIPDRMTDINDGEILMESLRQRCIYEVVSKEDPDGSLQKWFDYTVGFLDNCMDKTIFGSDCSYAQIKNTGINYDEVRKCVEGSFVRRGDGLIIDNTILAEDTNWAKNLGIFLHPSVTINNITYRGDINGYDVFRAICAGFSSQPDVCKGQNIFNTVAKLDQTTSSSSRPRPSHIQGHHILLAIVVVMILNFGALYLYRRYN
jgi:hypothetical protein